MAWFKTGGGGELSETVLWTNPSPNSNFSNSTVNLISGAKLSDYKYIKISAKYSTSGSKLTSVIYSLDEFVKFKAPSGSTSYFQGGICFHGSIDVARVIRYVNDTSVRIASCIQINGTNTTDSYAIPITISGLK